MRLAASALLLIFTAFGADAPKDRFRPLQRKYWALQRVVRPAPPVVHDSRWVRNPIDAFVLEKLEAKGSHPVRLPAK